MQIYKAITAVQADMSKEGIGKSRKNTQQGYNFRGIDDVYNALAPMLARHGLCILPRMLSRTVTERETAKGGVLFYVIVEAEFDLVAAEDGSKHTVRTYGEAMDSGDKATNKAMSAAYKYAAFQAFAIPTEGDNDADAHTHDVVPARIKPTDGAWEAMDEDTQAWLMKVAVEVIARLAKDPADAHDYLQSQQLGADEKAALWSKLDSKTRSALKKAHDAAKENAA